MPFKTETLVNLPVIYTQYIGEITATDLEESMVDIPNLIQQIGQPQIFHILDIRNSNIDFGELLSFLNRLAKNPPDYLHRIAFEPMFVGSNSMVKLSTQFLSKQQFGGISIPIFKTYEDAIVFIQTRIRELNNQSVKNDAEIC